ncbi:hypothetical protein [Streptomyces monashensis]|uniref:hypothetical protein n=1 Tax=Streptomyces monashensis TaxID=1678012 RepID=UPI0015A6C197|nr:hypothetical protein [Streptomyces monashensis]
MAFPRDDHESARRDGHEMPFGEPGTAAVGGAGSAADTRVRVPATGRSVAGFTRA